LQSSDRLAIVKKHVKRGSGRAWSCTDGALGNSGSISRFEQKKVHRKLVNRHTEQFIRSGCRTIWIYSWQLCGPSHTGLLRWFTLNHFPWHRIIDLNTPFLYYSFVTLTTLVYGDIFPVSTAAKACAILEAAIGQPYLVITIAWLVGAHISQSMQKK